MEVPNGILLNYNGRYCTPSSLFSPNFKQQAYSSPTGLYDWARHIEEPAPDILLLTPAIFGGVATFILGFGFYGNSFTAGYKKFIFFIDIFALIATFLAGDYIFQLLSIKKDDSRFKSICFPLFIMILFYSGIYNLLYSLYPGTFSGTIGKTRSTQFLSFLALAIGTISVGETFNIDMEDTGVQVLVASETLFNLFVITLIVALLS